MSEVTLATVEGMTKRYSEEREELARLVRALNDDLERIKKSAMAGIKRAVNKTAERQAELWTVVNGARHLFVKPRTVIFHGIKVGLQKGKGGIDWDEDETVAALIEKHFPKAQAELLIKTTKKPIAKALGGLDVADLKRIGCRVEDTGDVIVISAADSEVEKVVNALLKDAGEES
jgi:hypothetical protein